MQTKIHEIDWKNMKSLEGMLFETGMLHEIKVIKETIPIIFLPGIMGTNLKGANGVVWYPSVPRWMKSHYSNATPSERKQKLIDDRTVDVLRFRTDATSDAEFLKTARDAIHAGKAPFFDWLDHPRLGSMLLEEEDWNDFAARQVGKMGWSEISADSYLEYLVHLSQPESYGPYLKYFLLPVYAFGYNWIKDNAIAGKLLLTRIEEIIATENKKPKRYCKKVIVVTHSMGGLVARSAMQQGAKCMIAGVVHGAQPVTGAPAAYRRMRAGFEPDLGVGHAYDKGLILDYWSRNTLGPSAEHVVPILGNAVGGLELFPTSLYRDNHGSPQWLGELDATGKVIGELLPKGDPYSEIYARQGTFLSLITDPKQLDPSNSSTADGKKKTADGYSAAADPFQEFCKSVKTARDFHSGLGLFQHDPEKTYAMFSSGFPSFHQIRYRYQRDATVTFVTGEDTVTTTVLVDANVGKGTDLDSNYRAEHRGSYFTIDDPTKLSGDGTVPVSSATALQAKNTFHAPPIGHQDFFTDAEVREASTVFIMNILEGYLDEQVPGRHS